jgi:hypothetical protein
MSIDDASQQARFCKLFYEPTRDEVLRSHTWNFAKQRQTLTKLSAAPAFGWSNAFQLPADFIREVRVNEWESYQADDNWVIEGNQLLTDQDTIELLYIYRVVDSTLFDPLFVKAFSVLLASELVTTLTGSREQGQAFLTEYQQILAPLAKRIDGMENHDKRKLPWVNSDLVNARFGFGSF